MSETDILSATGSASEVEHDDRQHRNRANLPRTTHRASHYAIGFGLLIALLAALRFNGVDLSWYALALSALFVALGVRVFQAYGQGLGLPRDALPVVLTLFWCWLGVTAIWSPTTYLTLINVWWVGSLPFAFWLYRLAPGPEPLWRWLFPALVLLGGALAVYALVQFTLLHADPRATFLNRNSLAAFLNLLALPLAAIYLCTPTAGLSDKWRQDGLSRRPWRRLIDRSAPVLLPVVLLLLVTVIGLSRSRGAMLGLFLGSGILLYAAVLQTSSAAPWRRLAVLAMVLFAGLGIADVLREGQVLTRLMSLDQPQLAGADRFLIWGPSLHLLWQHVWLGTGLGTYWLFWPPYRLPMDSSAGFYVHNDYLQLWIETGLPGLLLWLAVLGASIRLYVRLLRNSAAATRHVLEAGGLLGGLAAMALHSFFTFNLYTQPILLLAGILLGRFHYLATLPTAAPVTPSPSLHITPQRFMTRRGYRLLVILIFTLPLMQFASLALALNFVDRARHALAERHLAVANARLTRAELFAPGLDTIWYMHADLAVRAMHGLRPGSQDAQRKTLYRLALDKLAHAQADNPLRAQTFTVRGNLYADNPDLAGAQAFALAQAQYTHALALDPRHLPARMGLARLLSRQDQTLRALQVLKAGLGYWYPPDRQTADYYAATLSLARRVDDPTALSWLRINAQLLGMTAGKGGEP